MMYKELNEQKVFIEVYNERDHCSFKNTTVPK